MQFFGNYFRCHVETLGVSLQSNVSPSATCTVTWVILYIRAEIEYFYSPTIQIFLSLSSENLLNKF